MLTCVLQDGSDLKQFSMILKLRANPRNPKKLSLQFVDDTMGDSFAMQEFLR
jgi:hypothetical protein